MPWNLAYSKITDKIYVIGSVRNFFLIYIYIIKCDSPIVVMDQSNLFDFCEILKADKMMEIEALKFLIQTLLELYTR